MISAICRYIMHDEFIQRAAQLIAMTMHNMTSLEAEVIVEFIQKEVTYFFMPRRVSKCSHLIVDQLVCYLTSRWS